MSAEGGHISVDVDLRRKGEFSSRWFNNGNHLLVDTVNHGLLQ